MSRYNRDDLEFCSSDKTGKPLRVVSKRFGIMFETLKTLLVYIRRYTEIIWNYIEIVGLVSLYISLHIVFWNLVALEITSDKTTWSYRELQMSCQLEHGLRHYNCLPSRI